MPKLIKPESLNPYWQTLDGSTRLYHGDVIAVLQKLPANSVHCVMTSPPYWALRNYGVEGQIGSEPTPQAFIEKMVEVFAEVHRVLRDDGIMFLNLGDSYGGGTTGGFSDKSTLSGFTSANVKGRQMAREQNNAAKVIRTLPSGNLLGMPWRTALALQDWGWILRQDIIWHKPCPMPESVTNRCTKAHEYVFLLAKHKDYYYDADAIREEGVTEEVTAEEYELMKDDSNGDRWYQSSDNHNFNGKKQGNRYSSFVPPGGRNKRDVWTISPEGYGGKHFATFPKKLVEPCLLAGTSAYGCCVSCGSPYKRVTDRTKRSRPRPNDYVKRSGEEGTGNSCANTVAGVDVRTLGWEKTCECRFYKLKDNVPPKVIEELKSRGLI